MNNKNERKNELMSLCDLGICSVSHSPLNRWSLAVAVPRSLTTMGRIQNVMLLLERKILHIHARMSPLVLVTNKALCVVSYTAFSIHSGLAELSIPGSVPDFFLWCFLDAINYSV